MRAWIPAEKVDRAIKEGRLTIPGREELMEEYTALQREAAERTRKATEEAMAEIERLKGMKAAEGGAEDEEIGSWY